MPGSNRPPGDDALTPLRALMAVVLGLVGFAADFFPLVLVLGGYRLELYLGLVLPLLVSQAWGWRAGLISAVAGLGCQNGWLIWPGWGAVVLTPPVTLWVVWHGWLAGRREEPSGLGPYLAEVPFRLANTVLIYTLYPWVVGFNPAPWAPGFTAATLPDAHLDALAIGQLINALVALVLCELALNLAWVRRALGLPRREGDTQSSIILVISLLLGCAFWVFDLAMDYYRFQPFPGSTPEGLHDQELLIRTAFLFCLLAGGVIASRLLRKVRASDRQYRQVVETVASVVLRLDPQGLITFVNPYGERFFGYTAAEMIGRSPLGLILPRSASDGTDLEAWFRRYLAAPAPVTGHEHESLKRDGWRAMVAWTYQPVFDTRGRLGEILCVGNDVTALRVVQARQQGHLRHLEAMDQVRRALTGSSDPEKALEACLAAMLEIFDCDRSWLIYPCIAESRYYRVPLEATRDGWPGAKAAGAVLEVNPGEVHWMRAVLEGPEPVGYQEDSGLLPDSIKERFNIRSGLAMALHPRVGQAWMLGIHTCGEVRYWSNEEHHLLQEIGGRMTDALNQSLIMRQLATSEERYRSLFEQAGEAIALVEPQGLHLVDFNPQARRDLAYSETEMARKTLTDLVSPPRRQELVRELEAAQEEGAASLETSLVTGDGQEREALLRLRPVTIGERSLIQAVWRDVTEERRLERQLRQAQKMEAVGTLAGGIAHDFNNALQAILGYAHILLLSHPAGTPGHEELGMIVKSVERSGDLIRRLMTFSRRSDKALGPVDLNAEVEQVGGMLARLLPGSVALEMDLEPGAGRIASRPAQVEQLLMNLALNARDAMPQGGVLRLATNRVELDREFCRVVPEAQPGPHLRLTVEDQGVGMAPEVLEHIFEPFFTTKPSGKGTGLGLAMVYGLVRNQGGFIQVHSRVGAGTRFELYWPASSDAGQASPAAQSLEALRGQESVLVVDDEPALRDLAAAILERYGYTVATAASGEDALEIHAQAGGGLDLVVMDVGMPGMGGLRCLEELQARDGGLKVLMISGYAPTLALERAIRGPGVSFLPKPFQVASLLGAVRRMLDAPAPPGGEAGA